MKGVTIMACQFKDKCPSYSRRCDSPKQDFSSCISLWEEAADYCVNDVIATEAAFDYLHADLVNAIRHHNKKTKAHKGLLRVIKERVNRWIKRKPHRNSCRHSYERSDNYEDKME